MDVRVEDLVIERTLSPEHRQRAAEIIYEAFSRKLEPLLGTREHSLALVATSLQLDRVLGALLRGELVGLAGLHYKGRQPLVYRWADVSRELGWLAGFPRLAVLRFIASSPRPSELIVEHLAVAAAQRGRGVGTRLLEAAFDLARANDLSAVRLGVVDTNPRARRLYERLGFQPTGTLRLPFLFRVAGFSALTDMVKRLEGGSS